jgi:hypothetical protein
MADSASDYEGSDADTTELNGAGLRPSKRDASERLKLRRKCVEVVPPQPKKKGSRLPADLQTAV